MDFRTDCLTSSADVVHPRACLELPMPLFYSVFSLILLSGVVTLLEDFFPFSNWILMSFGVNIYV